MALTVPTGGISAGRAAEVRVQAPDTGALIAGLGDRMLQIGTAIEKDRLARELARSRIDMMKGLNELRVEFEQEGDPDVIDREFGPRATALRDSIFANVDPRNRGDAQLMFDELQMGHASALGYRAIGQRQSQNRAILIQTESTLVDTGALADQGTQDGYLDQYRATLNQMVANGTLTPEEAEGRFQTVRGDMRGAAMTRLLSDDPAALVAAIDSGALGADGNPEVTQGFRARGVSAVAERAARADVEGRRIEAARLDEARDLYRDGIAVIRKGQPFSRFKDAVSGLADPAIAALPEAQEYAHAVALAQTMPGFNVASLADKRAMLATAKAAPKEKGYEADVVPAMEAAIAAHEAGVKDDFYGYAEAIGLTAVAPLAEPTASSEELFASLKTRVREANALGQTQIAGSKPVPIFRPDEREAWKAAIAPEAAPADRLRVAEAIAVLPREDAERALAEITTDAVFGHVGGGIAAQALPRSTALAVLEGTRVITRQDVKLPPVTERRNAFFQQFSSLFADGTGPTEYDEAAERDALIASADALYAYRVRGTDTDGTYDEAVWNQALHEVAGGTGSFDRGDATGGVATLNYQQDPYTVTSYPVFLPRGVSTSQVETAQDKMLETFDAMAAVADAAGWSERIAKTWGEVSADGRVPDLGGQPIDAATLRRMRLVNVGGNLYRLEATDNRTDQPVTLQDKNGKPFFLDMGKFLQRFGEAP